LRGAGKLLRGEQAIERHRDARPLRDGHQTLQLRSSDYRVGDQHVAWRGRQHHLCLAHFRYGQSRRSQIQLPPADARRFVSLGVRAQPEPVPPGVIRHAAEVALHRLQIHQQGGCIDILHPYHFSWRKRIVILSSEGM
jgi:hypothetical protein